MIEVLSFIATAFTLAIGAGLVGVGVYLELADWRDAPARKEERRNDAYSKRNGTGR